MPGMQDILGLLSNLGGPGGLAGLGSLGGLAGMSSKNNPLAALSMIGTLSQLGKGGNINDILGMLSNFTGNAETPPQQDSEEEAENEINAKERPSSSTYPCDNCHVHCDRARLGLPAYKEVRQMAAKWRRY